MLHMFYVALCSYVYCIAAKADMLTCTSQASVVKQRRSITLPQGRVVLHQDISLLLLLHEQQNTCSKIYAVKMLQSMLPKCSGVPASMLAA